MKSLNFLQLFFSLQPYPPFPFCRQISTFIPRSILPINEYLFKTPQYQEAITMSWIIPTATMHFSAGGNIDPEARLHPPYVPPIITHPNLPVQTVYFSAPSPEPRTPSSYIPPKKHITRRRAAGLASRHQFTTFHILATPHAAAAPHPATATALPNHFSAVRTGKTWTSAPSSPI
jgi:hypothetical protein